MHTRASLFLGSKSGAFRVSGGIYMDCVMGCCNLGPFHKLQTPIFHRLSGTGGNAKLPAAESLKILRGRKINFPMAISAATEERSGIYD
jgi:hypothetical protein